MMMMMMMGLMSALPPFPSLHARFVSHHSRLHAASCHLVVRPISKPNQGP